MCSDKSKKKTGALKCALIGLGAGIAVGMVGKALMDTNKRTLKKRATKVAAAMENLADSAMEMFK